MNSKAVEEQIRLNKEEIGLLENGIKLLQDKIVRLEIILESEKAIGNIKPGDNIFVHSDNPIKKSEITRNIKDKYETKDVFMYVYVSKTEIGPTNRHLREIYNDDVDYIKSFFGREKYLIEHDKKWNFSIISYGKKVDHEQYLKYLVCKIGGWDIHDDILVERYGDISYNSLYKIILPFIHIVDNSDDFNDSDDSDNCEKYEDLFVNGEIFDHPDYGELDIHVLSFVGDSKYCNLEHDIIKD